MDFIVLAPREVSTKCTSRQDSKRFIRYFGEISITYTAHVMRETPARGAFVKKSKVLFLLYLWYADVMSVFPLPIESFNEKEFKILDVVPCQKQFLFHSSGKKLKTLDPKHNRVLEAYSSHEYGIPVIYASDKPSNAFCYEPTPLYEQTKEKLGTSVYHRLSHGNHKILLGAKLKGYIYVLFGKDFYEVTREDFETGKWIRSVEWISDKEVTPVDSIEIKDPYDWEMIPEYQFLGEQYVGEMSVEEYLSISTDEKVKESIRRVIEKDFRSIVPEELKKYL